MRLTHTPSGGGFTTAATLVVTVDDDIEQHRILTADCTNAVWTSVVTFSDSTAEDRGRYSLAYHLTDVPGSSLSPSRFVVDGDTYTAIGLHVVAHDPASQTHTFRDSGLLLYVVRGTFGADRPIPSDVYSRWTFHIGDQSLPMAAANRGGSGRYFDWRGAAAQSLYEDWSPNTTFEVCITQQDSALSQSVGVPGAPIPIDVQPTGTTSLRIAWVIPLDDGGTAITGYKVEWKEADDVPGPG